MCPSTVGKTNKIRKFPGRIYQKLNGWLTSELGPNGGIITSLNLFATKFDQVLNLIDRRSDQVDHVIFDTPGQIEVFTWSASGNIITEALAAQFPTVIVYVLDAVRSKDPVTFMSNMLYACSILYKTKVALFFNVRLNFGGSVESLNLHIYYKQGSP